jgi:hypothetical protein
MRHADPKLIFDQSVTTPNLLTPEPPTPHSLTSEPARCGVLGS